MHGGTDGHIDPGTPDEEPAAARALDAALARLEDSVGDPEFVAELLGDFVEGLPGQIDGLQSACSAGDAEQVHRIAHTLKSNAATFGADGLALACRALEGAAAGGGQDTEELVTRVAAEAGRAAPALAAARDERLS